MTVQIDGTDVMAIAEGLAWAGTIVAMLIIGLLVYLMVRPPRRRHETRVQEPEAIENEELLRLLERMEQRLTVLERAVSDDSDDRVLERAEGPETRRVT